MREITSNIYYTGILNPNMRVFDVIMYTDYGTSYNSYIVKGSEKIALIEGAHATYLKNFEENIKDVIGEDPIDYLVLNHTEPDHTGALTKFLDLYPNIEILCSAAAKIYLANITNRDDLNIRVVKDGEQISLGDKTLEFISAPFLHWPDSMFTYIPEDRILFSCDFFGCHYCEPQILDQRVVYEEKYWDALEYYYEKIFGPFPTFVASGLDKIKDLEIDYVCNSHGPVLTKDGYWPEVLERYQEWAMPQQREEKLIPIFYCTAYNGTKRLAEAIQKGILTVYPNATVETYNIIENDMEMQQDLMNDSDAFLLGTLTINRDAVPPLWELLAGMDAVNIPKRPVALFGSYGWSGEAFANITQRLEGVKAKVYPEEYKIKFVPSEDELKKAEEFGVAFAKTLE